MTFLKKPIVYCLISTVYVCFSGVNEVKSVIVVREVLQVQDEAEVDEAKEGDEVQDLRLVDHVVGGLSECFGLFMLVSCMGLIL